MYFRKKLRTNMETGLVKKERKKNNKEKVVEI